MASGVRKTQALGAGAARGPPDPMQVGLQLDRMAGTKLRKRSLCSTRKRLDGRMNTGRLAPDDAVVRATTTRNVDGVGVQAFPGDVVKRGRHIAMDQMRTNFVVVALEQRFLHIPWSGVRRDDGEGRM